MKCALWHNDFGSIPIKNILLCGPSGCGKSLLPRAIAGEYNFEFNEIDLSVLLENGYVNVVRKLNEKLTVFANQQRAAILFFDNLNLLAINESNNNNNNSQKSVAAKNISKTICQFIDCKYIFALIIQRFMGVASLKLKGNQLFKIDIQGVFLMMVKNLRVIEILYIS